jgi:hypothetical protein
MNSTIDYLQNASGESLLFLTTAVFFIVLFVLLKIDRSEKDSKKKDRKWWYRNIYLNTPHWKRVRLMALKRDRYQCTICYAKGTHKNPLQVHHKTYQFIHFEDRHLHTVQTVCRRCHKRLHR